MRVYKYNLATTELSLPKGATPLYVAVQSGVTMMWALVDPDAPLESRSFFVAGTGHDISLSEAGRYINTFFDGPYVFHVFEAYKA